MIGHWVKISDQLVYRIEYNCMTIRSRVPLTEAMIETALDHGKYLLDTSVLPAGMPLAGCILLDRAVIPVVKIIDPQYELHGNGD